MPSDPEASKLRAEKLANFNPDENGLTHKGIFGLPFNTDESSLVLIPVPWDVTVSYGEGTLEGPQTILEASHQIDLYDELTPGAWRWGMAMESISENWKDLSQEFRAKAKYNIDHLEGKFDAPEQVRSEVYEELGNACAMLNDWVKEEAEYWLDKGKLVGLVGGEHSIPLGYLTAMNEQYETFGVLQIDAHLDLREAYQGFQYSHASVMYNALSLPSMTHLVPVGVRDFSEKEMACVQDNPERIIPFTDTHLKNQFYEGQNWRSICDRIVEQLPQHVYISFDIDGLAPSLCPNTGTPVPGGLNFNQAAYLVHRVAESGRTIIGFDLSEVAPGKDSKGQFQEWDGNVGARVLYRLCGDTVWSNRLAGE